LKGKNVSTDVNSVAELLEDAPLSIRLAAMSKLELTEFAKEAYSLDVDDNLKKDVIVDAILKFDEELKNSARTMNERSAAMVMSADDPLLKVRFIPQDFPNAPVEFMYDSGRGVRGPVNKKGLRSIPHYKLFPRQVYKLPLSVIQHMRGLTFSDSVPTFDPNTGMIVANRAVVKQRFVMEPILDDKQYRQMGTTDLGD
jgi:hypothetical protein